SVTSLELLRQFGTCLTHTVEATLEGEQDVIGTSSGNPRPDYASRDRGVYGRFGHADQGANWAGAGKRTDVESRTIQEGVRNPEGEGRGARTGEAEWNPAHDQERVALTTGDAGSDLDLQPKTDSGDAPRTKAHTKRRAAKWETIPGTQAHLGPNA